jgi:hypothetical protein
VNGNYAVLNPGQSGGPSTSSGNLSYTSSSGMVLADYPIYNGKYYWEVQAEPTNTVAGLIGLALASVTLTTNPGVSSSSWAYNTASGQTVNNGTSGSYGTALSAGKTLGIAFDADNGRIYYSIDNVWQNSGNPVTQVNPAFSNLTSGPYYPCFGGSTGGNSMYINFGVRPYVYTAPSGYKVLVQDTSTNSLTFFDDTSLSDFVAGDLVSEISGDASGVVSSIDLINNQLVLGFTQGVWTIGSTVQDDSRTVPAPAPTTEPPNPLLYTEIVNVVGSTSNLTSLPVAKPPLDPFLLYYARVRYRSNTPQTNSSFSAWSGFTTGAMT